MRPLLPALLAALPLTAAAQPADRGAFVTTLGRDTVAVEQFTRRPSDRGSVLEGDVITRQPEVRVTHYVIALDAQGRPASVETHTRTAAGAPVPQFPLAIKGTFAADTAAYEVAFADSVERLRVGAPAGALPFVGSSYAIYEVGTRRARAAGRAADTLYVAAPGGRRASALALRLVGDSAQLDYFGDPVLMRLDREGRILAVDGSRTTNKVTVTRAPSVDVAGAARAFAARPAMGAPSPLDSVRVTMGAAQVAVVYSRPAARGRTVWGGTLVPYGAVWRTGANAATAFRTSADLTVGGVRVPAGSYTLFTLPAAAGSQLIISKKTGEWGTEYDASQDLARVPLTATALPAAVEQFTILVEPAGADPSGAARGVLRMRWADRELSVPVAVAR